MRRKDKEILDERILKEILKRARYITIAMCRGGEPYLVTLTHGYDEEKNSIYFHCATEGKKLDFLRENPRVWGQAIIDHGYQEGECNHLYASVMFGGRVTFISDREGKLHALRLMIRHQEKNPDALMRRLEGWVRDGTLDRALVGRIDIEEFTGKKSPEVSI
ncbi:pyridoxamine 5'-phosphate oxidase family protein [Candidatus Bathyarchaeota archaeon]|nr:pyridoxamine 5'-phosphate oxidase family protein [Candidatus Bathyarchaeota archaeon]